MKWRSRNSVGDCDSRRLIVMLCFPKRLPRIGDDPVWNEFCCSNVLFIQFFVHARLDDQRGWLAFWELISERCAIRSEEHTSELQSRGHLVCRLLLEKKKQQSYNPS